MQPLKSYDPVYPGEILIRLRTGDENITIEKEYKVIMDKGSEIIIINDKGNRDYYTKRYFARPQTNWKPVGRMLP